MPVYNAGDYLVEAIESILNQTYSNFELIIVNDASTDKSWKIMQGYKKMFSRKIKLFKNQKNQGAFAAANIAISHAKGNYLAPMDADDVAKPERLAEQVKFLKQNPQVILVGSNAEIIDQNNNITGYKKYGLTHQEMYQQMALINPIVHPACMIRKSLLPNQNKLYLTNYGVNSDYFTFFQLLNYGQFANIPKDLLSYRIHGKNSSLINLKAKFFNTVKIRFAAVKEFDYHMPRFAYLVILIQCLIVLCIPGKLLLPIYLFIRGMKQAQLPANLGIKNTMINRLKYSLSLL